MAWNKKRRTPGKNRYYSLSKKLRRESKINDEFEAMVNNLSLEEIIGLKLELASRHFGGKMYGIPIWHSLKNIVQDAILKYTMSATRTKKEASRFLGLTPADLNKLLKKYDVENYFEKNDKNELTSEL